MRNFIMAAAVAALAVPAAPVLADPPAHAKAYGKRAKDNDRRYYDRARYDDRGRYYEPRRISRNDSMWRGNDGRYYCKRDNGTTGLVIGAGVGALAGSELAGRGDKTLGAIIGAVGGGLIGREIDRGSLNCR